CFLSPAVSERDDDAIDGRTKGNGPVTPFDAPEGRPPGALASGSLPTGSYLLGLFLEEDLRSGQEVGERDVVEDRGRHRAAGQRALVHLTGRDRELVDQLRIVPQEAFPLLAGEDPVRHRVGDGSPVPAPRLIERRDVEAGGEELHPDGVVPPEAED